MSEAIRMQLEFTALADPVAGSAALGDQAPRTFSGWIGLNGVIDTLLAAAEGHAVEVTAGTGAAAGRGSSRAEVCPQPASTTCSTCGSVLPHTAP